MEYQPVQFRNFILVYSNCGGEYMKGIYPTSQADVDRSMIIHKLVYKLSDLNAFEHPGYNRINHSSIFTYYNIVYRPTRIAI